MTTDYRIDLDELRALHGKSRIEPNYRIVDVRTDDRMLWITLEDGRVIGAPLEWFPRLREATPTQRQHWELWPRREAVHWPDVDEDINVKVLMGHPS